MAMRAQGHSPWQALLTSAFSVRTLRQNPEAFRYLAGATLVAILRLVGLLQQVETAYDLMWLHGMSPYVRHCPETNHPWLKAIPKQRPKRRLLRAL